MNSYLDIQVRTAESTPVPTVMSSVFSRLHLLLVERGDGSIGVSFPAADKTLGTILRLHGTPDALMDISPQFSRFEDYCIISAPREVPSKHLWYQVTRVQPKMSAAKVRRLVSRGSLSAAEAETMLRKPSSLSNPYVQVRSLSRGQAFRLFVDQRLADTPPKTAQTFNTYGLGGVIPWF